MRVYLKRNMSSEGRYISSRTRRSQGIRTTGSSQPADLRVGSGTYATMEPFSTEKDGALLLYLKTGFLSGEVRGTASQALVRRVSYREQRRRPDSFHRSCASNQRFSEAPPLISWNLHQPCRSRTKPSFSRERKETRFSLRRREPVRIEGKS